MKIRLLILLSLFSYSITSQAAITRCEYTETPCDQYGNHFDCRMSGWVGPQNPRFCSPDDSKSALPNEEDSQPELNN